MLRQEIHLESGAIPGAYADAGDMRTVPIVVARRLQIKPTDVGAASPGTAGMDCIPPVVIMVSRRTIPSAVLIDERRVIPLHTRVGGSVNNALPGDTPGP